MYSQWMKPRKVLLSLRVDQHVVVLLTTTEREDPKQLNQRTKTKLQKSLDTICATFMEVSQADVKR